MVSSMGPAPPPPRASRAPPGCGKCSDPSRSLAHAPRLSNPGPALDPREQPVVDEPAAPDHDVAVPGRSDLLRRPDEGLGIRKSSALPERRTPTVAIRKPSSTAAAWPRSGSDTTRSGVRARTPSRRSSPSRRDAPRADSLAGDALDRLRDTSLVSGTRGHDGDARQEPRVGAHRSAARGRREGCGSRPA